MNNILGRSNSDRIIGLDVVRFIAIISVVIYHSIPLLRPLTELPLLGRPLHYLFALTEPLGILGVEIFFALSGFLIGSILIRMYMQTEYFGFREVRSFLVRRWFRTLPTYWLILILNFAVFTALGLRSFTAQHLKYFFFLQNLDSSHPRFFPEAWSLAVEEWFYLTAPLALLLISYFLKKHSRKRRLVVMLIIYPVMSFVLRAVFSDNDDPNPLYFDQSVRKVVIMRLSSINYGVIIAFLRYFYAEKLSRMKKPLLVAGTAGIIILCAIHYAGIHPHFSLYRKSHTYRVFHNLVLISLIPFCASLLLPYAYSVRTLAYQNISKVVTFICNISYSMYLVHLTLVLKVTWHYIHPTLANCIPLCIGYWMFITLISHLLHKYFETPVMRLRNKFSKPDPSV